MHNSGVHAVLAGLADDAFKKKHACLLFTDAMFCTSHAFMTPHWFLISHRPSNWHNRDIRRLYDNNLQWPSQPCSARFVYKWNI
jgi:hypothetical protein